MAESLIAEPFVTFVVKKLGNLLIQEAQFLGGVRAQVQQLQTELNRMKCFLKAADARREEGDEIVRNWVAEIREIAYDAEDVIATFVVKVAFRTNRSGQFPFVLKRYLCIFNECVARHKVGLKIEVINTNIMNLTRSLQTYGIQSSTGRVVGGGGGESSSTRFERQQQLRRSYPHIVEEHLIGIEDNVKAVVDLLVDDKKKHLRVRVVSIWGMGGLGKTTLAKMVYNHNEVRRHFKCYAWAYISQQCNTREVLEGILIKLVSPLPKERKEIENLKFDELVEKLYKFQSENKCLVILDDIWKDEDWDSLSPAFPNTTKVGSKILLTTRNREVAKHVDQQCCIYELKHLTQEESWELFEKKISQRREESTAFTLSTKMIGLGKEMVKHCGGLPLAIVVLGGLLATKHQLDEWEMMSRNICYYLSKGKGQGGVPVTDILALSYQDLPYHLKACFLYLSHLPEDHDIPIKKLVQMWIAEGIVFSPVSTQVGGETSDGETMLDVGMSYLGELVQRCMVQVQLTRFSRRIKLCRLHDLMRDLCLLKAQEENFLRVVRIEAFGHKLVWADSVSSSSSLSLTTIRRLVVYYMGDHDATGTKSECVNPLRGNEMKNHYHIRSCQFHFFGNTLESSGWQKLKLLFKGHTLLTVLDLERIYFFDKGKMLPRAIGNLIQLRYLSIRGSYFKGLPFSIGNLGFLQTLDLRKRRYTLRIPNVLWRLKQLRHLYLPYEIKLFCSGKLRLDGLRKLETLENFDARYCDVRCFPKLTNLRKVRVRRVAPKDLVVILKFPIFSNNNNNNNSNHHHHHHLLLQSSSFRIDGDFLTEEEGRFLRQLLECDRLHKLYIYGSLNLVKLPDQFPPNLTLLTLWACKLEEDPMPTLEKLPNLKRLTLHKNSYIGKEMVCSAPTTLTSPSSSVGGYGCDGGFPQLKYLWLSYLENLEEWRVEEGAMPTLFHLEICQCDKLKEIPDGLRFITTLRELKISYVSEALEDRLREGGEDFYKIQHVPSITIR